MPVVGQVESGTLRRLPLLIRHFKRLAALESRIGVNRGSVRLSLIHISEKATRAKDVGRSLAGIILCMQISGYKTRPIGAGGNLGSSRKMVLAGACCGEAEFD